MRKEKLYCGVNERTATLFHAANEDDAKGRKAVRQIIASDLFNEWVRWNQELWNFMEATRVTADIEYRHVAGKDIKKFIAVRDKLVATMDKEPHPEMIRSLAMKVNKDLRGVRVANR